MTTFRIYMDNKYIQYCVEEDELYVEFPEMRNMTVDDRYVMMHNYMAYYKQYKTNKLVGFRVYGFKKLCKNQSNPNYQFVFDMVNVKELAYRIWLNS